MKVPPVLVPCLVVLAAVLGVGVGDRFAVPSLTRGYVRASPAGPLARAELVVDGLRCVDTARRVASQLDDVEGVQSFVAYAARHRAVITYAPSIASVVRIRESIEGPVFDPRTEEYLFHQFRVISIDGSPTK